MLSVSKRDFFIFRFRLKRTVTLSKGLSPANRWEIVFSNRVVNLTCDFLIDIKHMGSSGRNCFDGHFLSLTYLRTMYLTNQTAWIGGLISSYTCIRLISSVLLRIERLSVYCVPTYIPQVFCMTLTSCF